MKEEDMSIWVPVGMSLLGRVIDADVNVIGLIGERPREAWDFIKRNLGEKALRRSVIVVASNEQPAASRIRAAYVCTSIAEYFRTRKKFYDRNLE